MYEDIFFVSTIARVLQRSDVKAAAIHAFGEIQAAGEQPRYRRGHEQFLHFMASVQAAQIRSPFDGTTGPIAPDQPVRLVVERDGSPVATCHFHDRETTRVVAEIEPGHYRIRTETGLVLWEGAVAERDVIWAQGSPGEAIPVAAKTKEPCQKPTRQEHLTSAGMVVRFYAGAESGALEIQISRNEAKA